MSSVRSYNSALRRDQAEATRERILAAMAALVEEGEGQAPTNRAVAERARVTEVTVYRHFPSRELLLKGLWEHLNRKDGIRVGMPESPADLRAKIAPLLASFDTNPAQIVARVTTPQGRAARASLDPERREAFLAVVAQASPALPEGEQSKAAAVLQLLYSAYSWLSLREQWNLTGQPAADALGWAIEVLLADLKSRGAASIAPDPFALFTASTVQPES
ncbi:MAG: TetR/AcrR family transcriptional regulator [Pseudomonadota bacterium]|jgi:AcrR family transcriptional regulator|uniref:TetR/AcrR family transcriptional regulator n=1 Tax=Caulobacter sp. CCH9-E1 TaxID=1768768 RepID=UPI000834D7D2|nr:TetR/AcrR family transcriptional regulator [Caulobacter sp. CCH9-E1]